MHLVPRDPTTSQKVSIFDVVHLAKEAWNNINAETIGDYFYRGAFSKTNDEHEQSLPDKLADISEEM